MQELKEIPLRAVVALDPGTHRVGMAIAVMGELSYVRSIPVPGSRDVAERLTSLCADTLTVLLEQLEQYAPDEVVVLIESPSMMQGRPGQQDVWLAAGAIIGTIQTFHAVVAGKLAKEEGDGAEPETSPWSFRLVNPSTWKAAICGSASAGKADIAFAVKARHPSLKEEGTLVGQDALDALGMLTWWLDLQKIRDAEERQRAQALVKHVGEEMRRRERGE